MRYKLTLNANGDGFSCAIVTDGLTEKEVKQIASALKLQYDSLGLGSYSLFTQGKVVTDFFTLLDDAFISLSKKGENFILLLQSSKTRETATCSNIGNEEFFDAIPECITRALSCKNRKEVVDYINYYLISAQAKEDIDGASRGEYLVSNPKGASTEVSFHHVNFFERDISLEGHANLKYCTHQETPEKMVQFVRARSTFFVSNYKEGQKYKNTSWLSLIWITALLGYYLEAFKNNFAKDPIINELLKIKPTHYCDDFDQGYKSSQDIDVSSAEPNSSSLNM